MCEFGLQKFMLKEITSDMDSETSRLRITLRSSSPQCLSNSLNGFSVSIGQSDPTPRPLECETTVILRPRTVPCHD